MTDSPSPGGLRADLYLAELHITNIVESNSVSSGIRFPVALWESHGHRLLEAVNREDEHALIQAFCRLWGANGILDRIGKEDLPSPVAIPGDAADAMQRVLGNVTGAIEVLDKIEAEYEHREEQMLEMSTWMRLARAAGRR